MSAKVTVFPQDWLKRLISHGDPPQPYPILDNCITGLRLAQQWRHKLAYNEFIHKVLVVGALPWDEEKYRQPRTWTDGDDRSLAAWFQRHGIRVPVSVAADAVQVVARDQIINPLMDFLNNLEWDECPRIDCWLTRYLGAEDTDYTRAVGRKWLVSAVARAYQPGCKADCCIVLEGQQGIFKSTALRVLAGPELYGDFMGVDLASKEAAMQCEGSWIIELSELTSVHGSRASAVKAFLSRQEDVFRRPYDRHVSRVPRRCVFAGTTNQDVYLDDDTGNRRFWPVHCTEINIDWLAEDRDQIWAEAVTCYLNGAKWWMNAFEESRARAEQAKRTCRDVWFDDIFDWLHGPVDRAPVTTAEILQQCLHRESKDCTRSDQIRVGSCLHSMGWERYRDSKGRYLYAPNGNPRQKK